MKVTRIKKQGFKTNEIAVFLSVPLTRDNVTKNALLPKVLKRGTSNYKDQLEIGKQLENMYGASFNCGIDKTGDFSILKFYIETVCDKYLPNKQNLAQDAMNLIIDIIFNPFVNENEFNKEYVEQEKSNLEKIINSKKDNKANYAFNRCIEEMYKGKPYGLYKFGYIEDLKDIDEKNLYEYYKKMLKKSKIDIFINGIDADKIVIPKIHDINDKQIEEIIIDDVNLNNDNIQDIKEYVKENSEENETKEDIDNKSNINSDINIVKEKSDVTQGKLIIGLDAPTDNKYAVTMYNVVLGGGANSKLFQNVREKASLAYSAGSKYIRRKDSIFIITGIELQNYEKALDIIKKQIEDMKNGVITDDEIKSGKTLAIASLQAIPETQEDMISFYYDQELFNENLSVKQYINKIESITKDEIIKVAQNVKINTIYYLEK